LPAAVKLPYRLVRRWRDGGQGQRRRCRLGSGAEHNRIVLGLLNDHGARSLIKSKSMLEETGMREYHGENGSS